MESESRRRIISNFFLDGAKIIFGSLVVGAFIPAVAAAVPWPTVAAGITATAFFLAIAAALVESAKARNEPQP